MSQWLPYKLLLPGLCELAGFPFYDMDAGSHADAPLQLSAPGWRYDCAFNWFSRKFTFVSDSIMNLLGYDRRAFLEGGLEFLFSIVYPADVEVLTDIHRTIFACFYDTSVSLRSSLKFCYNLRLYAADGSLVHILRESVFLPNPEGRPLIEYITCTDISFYRESASVRLMIYRLAPQGTYVRLQDHEFKTECRRLSLREMEVARLAARGLTSKEIASLLNVSIDTVKSHRKNIMHKAGAVNFAQALVCLEIR